MVGPDSRAYEAGANDALAAAPSRGNGGLVPSSEQFAYARQLLEAHIANSPLAIIEFDPEFRVTRWSDVAERLFGYTAQEMLGQAIFELRWVHEDDVPLVEEESAGLHSGQKARSTSTNRNYRKDGTVIWCRWYNSAIYDADDRLVSVLSQVLDITEQVESQQLSEASANIDQLLHSSLHVSEIMDRAVWLAADALGADQGVIDAFHGDHFVVSHVFGWPAETKGTKVPLEESGPDLAALRTKKPLVIDDVFADSRTDRDHMERWGIRSVLAVPLVIRDEAGAVLNITYSQPHRFTPGEVAFAERLGTSLSLALENARLFEAEHKIAETLQETLVVLPTHVPGVEFSRAYETATAEKARVGGDFIDIFEVRKDLVAFAIGDVSGKGIDAAVTTSLVRNTLRVHALDGLSPADVGAKTNQVVRRFTAVDSFVTVFFGLLNTKNGLMRYVCAGHPPAIIVPASGELIELDCADPILGAFEGATFSERRTVLSRHDRVILYSDGITEARASDGRFLGDEGLLAAVAERRSLSTQALCEELIAFVHRFSSGVLRDDAALLVIEADCVRLPAADQPSLDFEDE